MRYKRLSCTISTAIVASLIGCMPARASEPGPNTCTPVTTAIQPAPPGPTGERHYGGTIRPEVSDIELLRKLTAEFSQELAMLGADVEQQKRNLSGLVERIRAEERRRDEHALDYLSADVPRSHWAYGAVDQGVEHGMMCGRSPHSFDGRAPRTRMEFAIATRALTVSLAAQILYRQSPLEWLSGSIPRSDTHIPTITGAIEPRLSANDPEALRWEQMLRYEFVLERLSIEFNDELKWVGVDLRRQASDLRFIRLAEKTWDAVNRYIPTVNSPVMLTK